MLLAGVVLTLPLSGCADLLFRQDHRVTVLNPGMYTTISQPVTVTWTAKDFTPGRDGEFVVFVDRSPMPPGNGLDYFTRNDTEGIFRTKQDQLRLDILPTLTSNQSSEQNNHEVTVILVDPHGQRIGEEAGFVAFTVKSPS